MISVLKNPFEVFELLFFAVFGQTSTEQLQTKTDTESVWVDSLFKMVFGAYMLVSVVVLINLLIAMMTDTYQRIQVRIVKKCYICTKIDLCLFYRHNLISSGNLVYPNWSEACTERPRLRLQ